MDFILKIFRCLRLLFHLIKDSIRIMIGYYRIMKFNHPVVSIFGSSLLEKNTVYGIHAFNTAHKLVEHNIVVLTGGGPGIMEAANCGAAEATKDNLIMTMGICISGIESEQSTNMCSKYYIQVDHFFARKFLLINYSQGFLVFPGGFGTMDELSEILNLMRTKKLPESPIILIGKKFWEHYWTWLKQTDAEGLLEGKPFIDITDDIDYAIKTLIQRCKSCTEE